MRWSPRRRGCTLAVLAVMVPTLAMAPAAAASPAPLATAASAGSATFLVGAAVESLDPAVAVYSGGFSASPPITRVHDPINVRALYVSNGHHAVAMEVVDAQGFFAAYQEGPFGITDIRRDAAHAITAAGVLPMAQGDIIVQATHGHADPTLEGIWGPVPIPYFHEVHDRAVAAIVEAARTARPAHLQWGTVDASQLDTTTIDTDSYPGWTADGLMTVLRALDVSSGATIATYVSVPVHGAHVCGQCLALLSADYFGAVRVQLEHELGGIAVVGPAVLGRQESPLEVTDIATMQFFARVVADFAVVALRHPHWIEDATVASSESFLQFPATNAALLGLDAANALPPAQRQAALTATGLYPIDRADTPPYLTGNLLGTWLTTLRIGRVEYASMPGEPFPEVSMILRRHITDADLVTVLSKGQDDFGYFFPAWVYPFTARYSSDHWLFSVAPQAGDQFLDGQLTNSAALGFHTSAYSAPEPLPTDLTRDTHPGLQALAAPFDTDATTSCTATVTFESIYAPPVFTDRQAAGPPHWSFGDGSTATTGYLVNSQNYGQTNNGPVGEPRFTHAFGVGSYAVNLTQADTSGDGVAWSLPVTVHPPLVVAVSAAGTAGGSVRYVATVSGGDGAVLAVRWRFGDGLTVDGPASVTHAAAAGAPTAATVSVTDATGTMATASITGSGTATSAVPDCATPATAAGVAGAVTPRLPNTGAPSQAWTAAAALASFLVLGLGLRRRHSRSCAIA